MINSRYVIWILFTIGIIAVIGLFKGQLGTPSVDNDQVILKPLKPTEQSKLNGLTLSDMVWDDLKIITVVRVPDTPSHKQIQNYILSQFQWGSWITESDTFTSNTPYGEKEFTNIIATYHPNAEKFLVLSAHYDSKYFEEFQFVAAIDSAVPCAILLDLARTLESYLSRLDDKWGLKLIFFDGEEAFKSWTSTDSLYGSRHLAEKMSKKNEDGTSDIEKIDLFILLDLIGSKNSPISSLIPSTKYYYDQLVSIETRLRKKNVLKSESKLFTDKAFSYAIEDDHVPFMRRNIKILHLIPAPFPPQWHRKTDDLDHIDLDTVLDWTIVIRTFVVEFFRLV